MAEFFTCIFTGTVIAISVLIPRWLIKELNASQTTFDQFIVADAACRSTLGDIQTDLHPYNRKATVTCPLRRMDFGAPDHPGHMPYALCLLLEDSNQPLTEGPLRCDYH